MRVGINASWLNGYTGGIGTYVRNVIRSLAVVDPAGDYVLYSNAPLPAQTQPPASRMRRIIVGAGSSRARLPFATSRALVRARVNVVHEQITAPFVFPARIVVTVHDTLHEHYPEFYTPSILQQLRRTMPVTMRRAAYIVTDSEFSKQDIVRLYHVPPEKVIVAYLAADPMF